MIRESFFRESSWHPGVLSAYSIKNSTGSGNPRAPDILVSAEMVGSRLSRSNSERYETESPDASDKASNDEQLEAFLRRLSTGPIAIRSFAFINGFEFVLIVTKQCVDKCH